MEENKLKALEGIVGNKLSTALAIVGFAGYQYLMIRHPEYKVLIAQFLNAPDTLATITMIMGLLYKGSSLPR